MDNNSKYTLKTTPDHLLDVQQKHIEHLEGYRMFYKAKPNGACLTNCVAVYIHEDETKGKDVKRAVNNHICGNWEQFYKFKTPLPYVQTVGVGRNAKRVQCETKRELFDFLKSDDSL